MSSAVPATALASCFHHAPCTPPSGLGRPRGDKKVSWAVPDPKCVWGCAENGLAPLKSAHRSVLERNATGDALMLVTSGAYLKSAAE
jgi:hypothetical protein